MKKTIHGLAGILAISAISGCSIDRSQTSSYAENRPSPQNYTLSKKCSPCEIEARKRVAIEKIKSNTPMSNEEMDKLTKEDWLDVKKTLGPEYKRYFGE